MSLPRIQLRSRLVKLSLWALGIVLVYTALGFLAVPALLKTVLINQIATVLHRQASVASVSFNPYTFEWRTRGFVMKDTIGSKPAIAFDELYLNISLSSLFRRGLVLSAVRLRKPYVSLIRTEDGRYNFSDIVDEMSAASKTRTEAEKSGGMRFSLSNIELTQGTVEVDDRLEHAHHALSELHLAAPFISNLPAQTDLYVTPRFEGKLNGEPFALAARSKPFKQDLDTTLEMSVEDVDIARYLRYVPIATNFKLASATLGARLDIAFVRGADNRASVDVSGTAHVDHVELTEPDGRPLVTLPQATFRIAQFDLIDESLALDEIRLESPEIHLRRAADGSINLMRLATARLQTRGGPTSRLSSSNGQHAKPQPAPAQTQGSPQGQHSPLTVQIKDVTVSKAGVDIEDEAVQPTFKMRVTPIELGVHQFAYPGTRPAQLDVTLATDRGATLKLAGGFDLTSRSATGSIRVAGVKPRDYASYWGDSVGFDLDDGVIDADGSYALHEDAGAPSFSLSAVHLGVRSLRVTSRADKTEVARVGAFDLTDGSFDFSKHLAVIGQITSRDAKVSAIRSRDGSLNLARLQKPSGGPASSPQPSSAPPVGASAPTVESNGRGPDWTWTVKRLTLDGYSIQLDDQMPAARVTTQLEPISLSLENLSSTPGTQATAQLRLRINRTGAVNAAGQFSVSPLAGRFTYDARNVDLVHYQPYVEQFLAIALTSGRLSGRGTLALEPGGPSGPRARVAASVSLADFACTDAATASDLLHWKSLELNNVSLSTAPLSVTVDEIALSQFYSRLVLNSDGRFNLQGLGSTAPKKGSRPQSAPPAAGSTEQEGKRIAAQEPPGGPRPAGSKVAQRVRIGRISLQGGNINYTDLFIRPNFNANLTDVAGTITGLQTDAPGDMDLHAKVDGTAPVDIAGKINPLGSLFYLDMGAKASDVQLPPLTPYSEKYIGYGIERGTLSLKLAYKVENDKLEATNNIYLAQLTFGNKVDSPDALKLPVLLAVSLLKDRDGVIDLNVPISGSLRDPQFSVGGVIVKVIVNLLTKAVTAPFALLASAFGGPGEELSYIEFDPGRAALTEASTGRLKALAQALRDRPSLKLDIAGRVDPAVDREALRQLLVDRSIKAQKFKELSKKGTPAASVDDITMTPEEYEHYLTLAYRAAPFEKPRNVIGLLRDLPAEEMKKLMFDNAKVDDAALRDLAQRRAQAAQSYLATSGGVEANRLFLLAPEITTEKVKGGKPTRAQFTLK